MKPLIVSGDSLEVVYPLERIKDHLYGLHYAHWPAWNIRGHYKILNQGGETVRHGSFPANGYAISKEGQPALSNPMYSSTIAIPAKTKGGQLQLWFQGTSRGPVFWDSDHEKNYVLKIE